MKRFGFLFLSALAACASPVEPSTAASSEAATDPCAGLTGTLTSDKTTVDRRTGSLGDVTAVLSWHLEVPSACDRSIPVFISDFVPADPYAEDGSQYFVMERTRTFQLRALNRVLSSVTVNVLGDPLPVSISAGPNLEASDLSQFNAVYMQRWQRELKLEETWYRLFTRQDAAQWEAFERMSAMVRMFDLTGDLQYATHLRELTNVLLPYRDDLHPGHDPHFGNLTLPPAIDLTRGQTQPLPAWGGASVSSGGFHRVTEASFAYIYAVAAYARIVMGNPTLRAQFGAEAVASINQLLPTEQLFAGQLASRATDTGVEMWLKKPMLSRVPTNAECDAALADEIARNGGDPSSTRNQTQLRICKGLGNEMGSPLPYNYRFLYMAAMTELWLALDDPFYRASTQGVVPGGRADQLRTDIPVRIARLLRYFNRRTHIHPISISKYWNYNDEVAPGVSTHIEDASHGSIDMAGLDVVRRNQVRLNAAAGAAGESIPVFSFNDLSWFARTVTVKLTASGNMADDLLGNAADPVDSRNGNCDGWTNFTEVEPLVFDRCYGITFRNVGNEQPYLNLASYASLLKNKHWRPTPPPPPPTNPPPVRCGPREKCCEQDASGCSLCIPSNRTCE